MTPRPIFAIALLVAGCTVDPSTNPNRCWPDGGCAGGRRCYRPAQIAASEPGFCVFGDDAGPCIPEAEICNGEDDDCDGRIDEELIHTREHCSRCGERCEGGAPDCVPTGGGGAYECGNCAFTICPPGSCADLQTDEENCGGCGARCDTGEFCVGGECSCGGTGPNCGGIPSSTCCGTECVDINTDERHCGACGEPCPDRGTCEAGGCRCGEQPDCRRSCTLSFVCL